MGDLDGCFFYHSMDLPGLGPQPGVWDLRGRFDDYIAREPIHGCSLLDVGAANGFLSFEAERRGASVVSHDTDSPDDLASLPFATSAERETFRAGLPDLIARTHRAYWLAHRLLRSRASTLRCNVTSLSPERAGSFDVVLIGQVLVHLPDAIAALRAAGSVCRRRLIIVEGVTQDHDPVAHFLGRAAKHAQFFAWYHYSRAWYVEVLGMLGFRDVRFQVGKFPCVAEGHASSIELTTVVAHR